MPMKPFVRTAAAWLQRRAENVVAILLGIMFVAFIIQIVFRYFFNFPTGWTSELSVITWLWMVLWGSAFVLKESEEIRFDLVYAAVGRRTRRIMGIIMAAAIVALYALSLPATWSYVTFMKVESTSYLHIRFDYLYSIFLIFIVAVIIRYVWMLGYLLRGGDLEAPDATKASSGL
jgi:C4-dicarboxylate transporter DctQ subunit